jgi:hypothetical protein
MPSSNREQLIEGLTIQAASPVFFDALETMMEMSDTSWESSSSSSSSSDDRDRQPKALHILEAVLQNRYIEPRKSIPREAAIIDLCLTVYRFNFPKEFRRYARMDPATFDRLVASIADADVFQNHSSSGQQQIPVEKQLFIALTRFGTYGNGAALSKIADLAGVGHGTIDLVTRRVITAIQHSDIVKQNIHWPDGEEREEAREMVHQKTGIHAFRNGWCMIDGTLIPLYQKPSWYGERFFDRKSRYSLNVQIVNTADRRIIDYCTGFRGTQVDSKAFRSTRLWKHHQTLLGANEWCWGDKGYPLYEWLIIPYKIPLSNIPDNKTFNYHLSAIRILCEHTIGYLKGRFQSMKELRVQIKNQNDFKYAIAWINTCIALHAFCVNDEESDQQDFFEDGVAHEQEERRLLGEETSAEDTRERDVSLAIGKARREELKGVLLEEILA